MDYNQSWKKVSNIEEEETQNCERIQESSEEAKKNAMNELHHTANQIAKHYCKSLEELGIPVFTAYYVPQKGYRYKAIFPEEISNPELASEYKKFNEFLKVCIGFNKEDYFL